jgi:hypothetical protein
MSSDTDVEVSALAINVTIPEALRWTDARRRETFILTTLNVRLLPDGHLAAKAYGRPVLGGRGNYTYIVVPDRPELAALIAAAADRAGSLWTPTAVSGEALRRHQPSAAWLTEETIDFALEGTDRNCGTPRECHTAAG